MFDLAKAFAGTYNPKTGLYLRKDKLWTLRMDLPRILAKRKAARKSGYEFRFMIMATNGARLNTNEEIANAKTYRRKAS